MKKLKAALSVILAVLIISASAVVSFADYVTEKEPDDSRETAFEFDIEDVVSGSLGGKSDVDWLKVTPTKKGRAFLDVEPTESTALIVTVYDSEDTEIVKYYTVESNRSPQFFVSPQAYYIKVEPDADYPSVHYLLEMTSAVLGKGDVEPNDDKASAGVINDGAKEGTFGFTGTVSPGDEDWFSFTCETGYFYCLLEKTDEADGSITAEFFIPEGTADRQLTSVTASETGKSVKGAEVGVSGGTFYIKVTGTGDYYFILYIRSNEYSEAEINDSFYAANPIVYSHLFGSLSHSSDVDYYSLNEDDLYKNIEVRFEAVSERNKSDYLNREEYVWHVDLIKEDGTVLESKTFSYDDMAAFNLTKYVKGTYYFKVYGDDNTPYSDYTLRLLPVEQYFRPINIRRLLVEIFYPVLYVFTILGRLARQLG